MAKIAWTDQTWNPVTGCTLISPGCAHCYAERMAYRLQAMGQPKYRNGFTVTVHEETLTLPLSWHTPRKVFVNSMADLFHHDVHPSFIAAVFDVMQQTPQHLYQILTKRAKRLRALSPSLPWADHIWMGVSVEAQLYTYRIETLRQAAVSHRFVSLEPLLGPLPTLNLQGIEWVIVGGESGPGARPLDLGWLRDLRDQCQALGIPYFVKQLTRAYTRDFKNIERFPLDLQIQQYPPGFPPSPVVRSPAAGVSRPDVARTGLQ